VIARSLAFGAFAFITSSVQGQQLRFSAERLARIDHAMQSYVDSGRIAGAATLVLQGGKVAHEGAYGWADRESGRRMTPDAIFRIASQTKAITSIAIMMLVEEGRLALADRVSLYMPTFSRTNVATRTDTGMAVVPTRRAITIRDLLTHTAGLSYGRDSLVASLYQAKGLGSAAGYGWYTADKAEPICETMDRLGTLPFVAQPGESFVYGYATDVLGCVVERVSGMSLDEFFRRRIFEPLGMRDTYFYLPPEKRNRLAIVYSSDPSGKTVARRSRTSRPGRLRRRATPELFRWRGPGVHRAGLRAILTNGAERWGAGWRAPAQPHDGAAHDN
jgi:CubicO group peptidase (beta-lactamase class C family)